MTPPPNAERPGGRYPWADAPEWAMFAATDEDGEAFWFKAEAVIVDGGVWWCRTDAKSAQIPGTFPSSDWRDSLEARPPASAASVGGDGRARVGATDLAARLMAYAAACEDTEDAETGLPAVFVPNTFSGDFFDLLVAAAEQLNSRPAPAVTPVAGDGMKWAQGLIEQLPRTHDGRNSWLLNYGVGEEPDFLRTEHARYSQAWRDWREGQPQPTLRRFSAPEAAMSVGGEAHKEMAEAWLAERCSDWDTTLSAGLFDEIVEELCRPILRASGQEGAE